MDTGRCILVIRAIALPHQGQQTILQVAHMPRQELARGERSQIANVDDVGRGWEVTYVDVVVNGQAFSCDFGSIEHLGSRRCDWTSLLLF